MENALAVSGPHARRETYLPLLQTVTHISPCFAYRGLRPGESERDYGVRVANELEAAILAAGSLITAALGWAAAARAQTRVPIKGKDIGGVVTSAHGPEA